MPRRDPAAFAEFVAARSAALHRTAYLMVGERQLAQDLLQEAFTKTYVKWPTLRDPAKAEAYTRKVITTTAISWYRRKSWQERPSDTIPEASHGGHADELTQREWVWSALQDLPPRQRAAIVLRYYEDLTEAQTAAALGCAVGTVKSQVHAGLATLRTTLDSRGGHLDLLPADLTVVNR
ncbi:SigE family RNA polymerase sigma factor [Nocardioides glacieisoli]|uniref:SigE family RNA polymerase sigma factor n=1 Tax=Nocardioides glacieisoli TaxID=1168730 RepID=A0A4Q2RI83_9ACTN|nr:SigE family RNA polymerase sigma factor [Nocardioides glacieisoli]RYB88431.1 SigE family RNA polymerase sigma factor [Nocardioides glacieisoli]